MVTHLSVNDMYKVLKSNCVQLPVKETIDIHVRVPNVAIYGGVKVLVCSTENTDIKGVTDLSLLYILTNSDHDKLNLMLMATTKMRDDPEFRQTGYCDREPDSRKITSIYLKPNEVIPLSFSGSLDELLAHPNVYRNMTDAMTGHKSQ